MDRFRRRSGGVAALKKTVSPDGFSYFAAAAIIAPKTYSVLLPRISRALALWSSPEEGISSVLAAGARKSTIDACTVRTTHFLVRRVGVVTVGVMQDRKLNRRIARFIGRRRDLHPILTRRESCPQFGWPLGGVMSVFAGWVLCAAAACTEPAVRTTLAATINVASFVGANP
jgi:hypothetical protein